MDTLGPDPARQLRIAHELIPRILGTGRAKTTLDVLVADPNLDQNSLALLSRIQWLNWHLADIPECAEMGVHLHVPEGFTAAREFLDALPSRILAPRRGGCSVPDGRARGNRLHGL